MRKLFALVAVAALLVAVAALSPAAGAGPGASAAGGFPPNKTVRVGDDFFRPSYLAGTASIRRNTLVRFNWVGVGTHNVTPSRVPSGVRKADFRSRAYIQGTGIKFQRRFRTLGTYRFYCSFHLPNMKITINVKR